MSALVFVDTNVLVYVRDRTDEEKQRMAAEWMTALWGSPGVVIIVRRHGDTLTGQPPGQPEFVLDPLSQTRFKVRGATTEIEVEFVTDEAGVMNKVLHQNGQEMQAPRREPGGGGGGAAG